MASISSSENIDTASSISSRAASASAAYSAGIEAHRLHRNEVDHALEVGFETDRNLHQHRVVAEFLSQALHDLARVGTGAIELVDECQARDLVALHLAIDGHRLRLHAGDTAQHEHRSVEDTQSALDFDGEVDVTGGVDDVDVVVVPLAVRRGGRNGDAALFLELHVVHGRADAILTAHLGNPVDAIGVEEDALGQGGLPRVDVCADTDVSNLLEVVNHGRTRTRELSAHGEAPIASPSQVAFQRSARGTLSGDATPHPTRTGRFGFPSAGGLRRPASTGSNDRTGTKRWATPSFRGNGTRFR
jgi:hypothetical protein